MTDYIKVFKEIVDILHHDYAGYDEKRGWDNPSLYLKEIEQLIADKQMTPQYFSMLVNEYLTAFQDQHMYFKFHGTDEIQAKNCGFRTRRYKDALYVIEAQEEDRFAIGSKIISIDHQDIKTLVTSGQVSLQKTSAEREDWSSYLNKSKVIEIEDKNGERLMFDLKSYKSLPHQSAPSMEIIDENSLLITLPSFANVDELVSFITEQEEKLKSSTNLIIDLRNNHGGSGNAATVLLPFVFPPNEYPSTDGELREFNYTNRNADLFILLCQKLRKTTTNKDSLKLFDSIEKDCETYRGQGFVTMDFSDEIEETFTFKGMDSPENIILLTDVYCASAAEFFVEICKESSKTRVIGRATMGVNDYSDLLIKDWGDLFSLYYPMSRRVHKTPHDPLHGKGIKPDYYIPWTPNHINEDLDLLAALELLQTGKISNI